MGRAMCLEEVVLLPHLTLLFCMHEESIDARVPSLWCYCKFAVPTTPIRFSADQVRVHGLWQK